MLQNIRISRGLRGLKTSQALITGTHNTELMTATDLPTVLIFSGLTTNGISAEMKRFWVLRGLYRTGVGLQTSAPRVTKLNIMTLFIDNLLCFGSQLVVISFLSSRWSIRIELYESVGSLHWWEAMRNDERHTQTFCLGGGGDDWGWGHNLLTTFEYFLLWVMLH